MSGAIISELFDNLAECLADTAKESKDRDFYEVQTEESAELKSMARKVEKMPFGEALAFLLTMEPLARREALMRLGIQTGVLVFVRVIETEKGEDHDA